MLPAGPRDDVLIEARGLTKTFGSSTAVDGIDVSVQRGESFGFLGPNGAGKSSTMRMVGCVSPPSGGSLRILGLDPVTDGPAIRARLGVVPQKDTLDEELTVEENTSSTAATSGCRATSCGAGPRSCWTSPSSPSAPATGSSPCPGA